MLSTRSLRRSLRALPLVLVLVPAADAAAAKKTARAAALSACPAAATQPSPDNLAVVERTTLCLLNRERTRRGLRRLDANGRLAQSAGRYSQHMAREDFFSHVSPGGGTMMARIREVGYLRGARSYTIGENLAWGSGRLATPRQIVRTWMKSPGHRANILKPAFREVGIGVVRARPVHGTHGATYAAEFGRRY